MLNLTLCRLYEGCASKIVRRENKLCITQSVKKIIL